MSTNRSSRRHRRLTPPVSLAAVCAAAAALVAPDLDAQFVKDDGSGLYSLPRSQDDIAALIDARTDLAAGRVDAAVQRLHDLLVRGAPGVVPIEGRRDRFLGMRQAVIETLRDLDATARQAYERLVGREGGHLTRRDLLELRPEQLAELADSFPTANAGLRARLRLGDLALESGRFVDALAAYRSAANALPRTGADTLREAVDARTRAARYLVDGANGARGDGGVLESELAPAIAHRGAEPWAAYGGGGTGSRPMADVIGRPRRLVSRQITAPGFSARDAMYPMHTVGDIDGLYVNDGLRVWALDPLAVDSPDPVLWVADGPMLEVTEGVFRDVAGGINKDMSLAAAVSDDVIVAALHVPNDVIGAAQTQRFRSIDVIQKIASRRLFAFDRATGKRLWAHWDSRSGPITKRFRGHDTAAPPLIHGDTVLVAGHDQTGAIAYYLSAYDLYDGSLRWRRLICSSQQEVNMFGNARQEFAGSTLAVDGGVVYGTTNLGVCFAADADDGELRWTTGYEVIPLPPTQLRNQEARPVFFGNNPAIIADGVMACTPLDSAYALGVDCASGEILWTLRYDGIARSDTAIRWLLGAIGNEFIFAGLGIVAQPARPSGTARLRLVASPDSLDEEGTWHSGLIPRGGVTDDRVYYVGSRSGISIRRPNGDRDPRAAEFALDGTGNLLLTDGLLVVTRDGQIDVYGDLDALITEARRRMRTDPDDPAAILRHASLLSSSLRSAAAGSGGRSDDGATVERLYVRGLDAAKARGLGVGSRVYRRLADGLFEHTLARAERLVARDADGALTLFRQARDSATQPTAWLATQERILELSADEPTEYAAELALMVERYGHVSHRFRGQGELPVAALGLWRSVDVLDDPAAAVQRCQELGDRFGDVRIDGEPLARAAGERIQQLIDAHGREVYAAIEAEAGALLATAEDRPEKLRLVARRYPHSNAAARATAMLLDIAVASGDLGAATEAFAKANANGFVATGVLRRMIEASVKRGNLGLAHRLADDLVTRAPDEVSDFAGDDGATYATAMKALPPTAVAEPFTPPIPTAVRAELRPSNTRSTLSHAAVHVADGFDRPFGDAGPPLYTVLDDKTLHALDTDPLAERLRDALFTTSVARDGTTKLYLCGETLVVADQQRVRGLNYRSGQEAWAVAAERDRALQPIGVTAGVLHVFSALRSSGGDGGRLLAIEPLTGQLLFRHAFPDDRDSVSPVASAGELLALDPRAEGRTPTVRHFDPITGRERRATPIGPAVLSFLQLDGNDSYRLYNPDLQTRMFTDGERVYLPVNSGNDEPPRLAAVDADGDLAWQWTGLRDRVLWMAARRDDAIVVLERGPSSRLVVLDRRTGQELRSRTLGAHARATNWASSAWHAGAPDPLFITDKDGTYRVTCATLTRDDVPSFQKDLSGVRRVLLGPVLGDGFVAIPVQQRQHTQPEIYVLDTRTRRSVLPNGHSALRLDAFPPFRMVAHGRYLVAETLESVLVLGPEGDSK